VNLPSNKQLLYLCALAEHRHFGRAAGFCFVSQSALSTGINELERNLGVTLFERGSSILLTEVGEQLAKQAQDVLNQLNNFVEHAKQAQGEFQSDLRLGVIPTIAPFLLPKIIQPISQKYDSSHLYIREDLSPNLLELLGKGELDVLLFALPYDTANFHTQALFEDELVVCISKDHELGAMHSVPIRNLRQQQVLLLEDGHCLRDQSLQACKLSAGDLNIPYQATSLNTLVQMVANNIGITLLPKMAVTANITHDTDTLIRPLASAQNISRTIALVWRKNTPRANEFQQLGEAILANR